MTAPDRIWITDKEVCGYFWEESELSLEDCFEPNVEYIRKGAFPVEDIHAVLRPDARHVDAWSREACATLQRILSLLEGE